MKLHSHSKEETQKAGRDLGRALALSSGSDPQFVGLIGDLGAGKTTFVQGLAEGMGIAEAVVSPTFTLVHV